MEVPEFLNIADAGTAGSFPASVRPIIGYTDITDTDADNRYWYW